MTWVEPDSSDQVKYDPQEVFEAGELNHHISNTAYPIAHAITWKPYRVRLEQHLQTVVKSFENLTDISLYTHIPFCEKRCYFCEYTVVGKDELSETKKYMDYLRKELENYSNILGRKRILGFDIGGGTPSFVDSKLLANHIDDVSRFFDLDKDTEISIETTPKIASDDIAKLKDYRSSGIKRISMGIQVTQPDLLKILGRSANGLDHIFKATENIRKVNFNKFNIDLMYGFADQTLESWESTLKVAMQLDPDYITLYRMRYKLTRISDQASRIELSKIRQMADLAKNFLSANGYYANPGKNTYSIINNDTGTSSYLTRRVIQGFPYLGLGLGAQTFTDTTISYNSGSVGKNLNPYFKKIDDGLLPIQDLYNLPLAHMMSKMIAVSFYFGEINLESFYNKFHIRLEDAYTDSVNYALEHGLMEYTNSINGLEILGNDHGTNRSQCLSLTPKGAKHFNGTIALFFASSIQKYLIERDPTKAQDMAINQKLAVKISA
ncbi:coproporphyrinogen-III oxidase family protein [Leptospira sp. GIMC2001]|uniref:coproporphyrinogen-III oxidase family protein n=1 Tax=Leptospira sp. GIMC2001 TaxID=1513297 RepID=UPI0023495C67|nr:radical SAM protein [Leptospira sp. GIMC2001]WCL47946.1 radical SAM protein [Leptospira sp. GIMC2001]